MSNKSMFARAIDAFPEVVPSNQLATNKVASLSTSAPLLTADMANLRVLQHTEPTPVVKQATNSAKK